MKKPKRTKKPKVRTTKPRTKPTKATGKTSKISSPRIRPKKTGKPGKTKPRVKPRVKKPKKRVAKKPKRFKQLLGMSEAQTRIQERLDATREALAGHGLDSRVLVHAYRNEIDGEIAVTVPRGITSVEISAQIEQALQTEPLGLGRGFWYSLGAIMSIHKKEEGERSGSSRIRGKDELEMYYRRISTPNMIDSFLRQQKVMLPGIEDKYNRKVETVYVRLHWNRTNEQPSR